MITRFQRSRNARSALSNLERKLSLPLETTLPLLLKEDALLLEKKEDLALSVESLKLRCGEEDLMEKELCAMPAE